MVSPSTYPLSEQLKVRTSLWKRSPGLERYRTLITPTETASDHFWECKRTKARATAAIKGSCLFAKHSNAIWQFRWRQQAQKNNCSHWLLHHSLPPHGPTFPSSLAKLKRTGAEQLWRKIFFFFISWLLHFREKLERETLSSICPQFSKSS